MALFTIEDREIRSLPKSRLAAYRGWRSRVPDADYDRIVAELNSRIEGTRIQTSSWMPGANWEGTPFHPIYAAVQDYELAAWFFGLIVWQVFIDRPERWYFVKPLTDGEDVRGTTYFQRT